MSKIVPSKHRCGYSHSPGGVRIEDVVDGGFLGSVWPPAKHILLLFRLQTDRVLSLLPDMCRIGHHPLFWHLHERCMHHVGARFANRKLLHGMEVLGVYRRGGVDIHCRGSHASGADHMHSDVRESNWCLGVNFHHIFVNGTGRSIQCK